MSDAQHPRMNLQEMDYLMKPIQRVGQAILMALMILPLQAQKKGEESINRTDLETHMKFLASDELEGRDTGEPGLYVAARYLACQAEKVGLVPAEGGNGYFQHYIIHERAYDFKRNQVLITTAGQPAVTNKDHFFMFPAVQNDLTVIEGGVVFAGYGINDQEHGYNDFEDVDIEGKLVLIMSRAPMNEDGTAMKFGGEKYSGMMSFRSKMPYIYAQNPKAVLVVYDPKSGMESVEDLNPGIASYLSRSRSLDPVDVSKESNMERPRMLLITRSLADQILQTAGQTLEELQMEIDREVVPRSFDLDSTTVRIEANMKHAELEVPNIFGMIEGADPELKGEMVIYLAHFDHVGTDGKGGVFNGADDNASGTVGLIEIAEAFMHEKKPPRRSVGFLWVSAEEIGLFGSSYFADHPLVPIEEIVSAINLDMIGRTKSEEDVQSTRSGLTIVGEDSVKVIGALQSSLLMGINEEALDELGLVGNYDYNDMNHPDRYFFRSDHINFARKDIPVLFYSTGTHRDYHQVTDTEDRIDYEKFERMVELSYLVGYKLANYRGSIVVDNPMSGWDN
jgi:hypothetical protein